MVVVRTVNTLIQIHFFGIVYHENETLFNIVMYVRYHASYHSIQMDFGVLTEIGVSRLVLSYSGWLFGGVFTGFHWLVFVPDICYNLSGYYGLFTKCTIVGQILSYWMCNIGR